MAGAGTAQKRRWLGLDCTATDVDRRADDAADAEKLEGQAGAHDIGDGIGGAHFVKVDFFDGYLVDGGFRLAELLEYREGICLGKFGEVGLLDDFDDVREMAVGFFGSLRRRGIWWRSMPRRLTFSKETDAPISRAAMALVIADWSAPASARAPTSMSPLIPERASR